MFPSILGVRIPSAVRCSEYRLKRQWSRGVPIDMRKARGRSSRARLLRLTSLLKGARRTVPISQQVLPVASSAEGPIQNVRPEPAPGTIPFPPRLERAPPDCQCQRAILPPPPSRTIHRKSCLRRDNGAPRPHSVGTPRYHASKYLRLNPQTESASNSIRRRVSPGHINRQTKCFPSEIRPCGTSEVRFSSNNNSAMQTFRTPLACSHSGAGDISARSGSIPHSGGVAARPSPEIFPVTTPIVLS